MKNLIRKYPVAAYYTIAFGWTWAVVTAMLISGQADVSSPGALFVLGGIICNISPSIAAFIVTRIVEGKEGVNRLRAGFFKKSPAGYYAIALLTVPVVTILTTVISNSFIRSYAPGITVPMIFLGLIWPLFSSTGEEFGWRGFILPKLIAKHGALKAGIILGIIWEVWHIPMHYMAYKDFGGYMIPAFLLIGFVNLTLQTVIMTWLFTRSNGSIRLMICYHYTITSSSILLGAFFKTDPAPSLTVYESIVSVAIFLIFAVVLYAGNKKREYLSEGERAC